SLLSPKSQPACYLLSQIPYPALASLTNPFLLAIQISTLYLLQPPPASVHLTRPRRSAALTCISVRCCLELQDVVVPPSSPAPPRPAAWHGLDLHPRVARICR
ncbi:unnamed protein product, partial [Urochloa humidicola]